MSYDDHFYLGESTIYDRLMSNFSVGSKNVPYLLRSQEESECQYIDLFCP